MDSFRIQETYKGEITLEKEDGPTPGISTGKPKHSEEKKNLLTNIIQTLNEAYGVNLTGEDKVDIENIKVKLEEDEELQAVMNGNNTLDNMRLKFDTVVDSLLLDFVHNKLDCIRNLRSRMLMSCLRISGLMDILDSKRIRISIERRVSPICISTYFIRINDET